MKSVFSFFLENSKLTFVITFVFFVIGLMGFSNLRRETRPAVDFAQAIVTTVFPGASSKEVEELVTFKIEEQIRVVDGIEHSRSTSSPGRSYIHLRIDIDNTDSTEVVDELQRSLSRVKGLPERRGFNSHKLHDSVCACVHIAWERMVRFSWFLLMQPEKYAKIYLL